MSNPKLRVVIVGGGFSGTVLAVQLLRRTPDLRVGIVDKAFALGRGLAYGTECRCHLLKVPAGNMSALPEEPDRVSGLQWRGPARSPSLPALARFLCPAAVTRHSLIVAFDTGETHVIAFGAV